MIYRPHVFAALAAAILTACSAASGTSGSAPSTAQLAVAVAQPASRSIERSVVASGPVAAWEEMQLGVELSGLRVTALHVDIGQAVRRGDVLLEIDHRTLDSDLNQANAALAEAQAGAELARTNHARGEKLAASHLISTSALDELRAALVQAQARVATAQAKRDSARLYRGFAALRAPDDGVISARLVQPGQVVSAGAELLRLIRRGRIEWRAELAENDLAGIAPGATVDVTAADGTHVAGLVRAVSPDIDRATRRGTVIADLPAPGPLKPGAYVEGRIVLGSAPALLLPASAITHSDGRAYVYRVESGDVVRRQPVQTGRRAGNEVEILDGVRAGQAIVVRGAGFLSDGDRVRVTATESVQ